MSKPSAVQETHERSPNAPVAAAVLRTARAASRRWTHGAESEFLTGALTEAKARLADLAGHAASLPDLAANTVRQPLALGGTRAPTQQARASRRTLGARGAQAVSAFLILSRLVLHPASGEAARTARTAPPPLAVFCSRPARVRLSPPGEGRRCCRRHVEERSGTCAAAAARRLLRMRTAGPGPECRARHRAGRRRARGSEAHR
jgi:hypothetical protein